MNDMHELIEEALIERVLGFLLWAGPLLGLGLGAGWGWWRRRWVEGLGKGLFLGLMGPLSWGMWRLYAYLTRYDPRTDYFGLERVDVFFLNLFLFAVVGSGLGWLWSILFPPEGEEKEDEEGRRKASCTEGGGNDGPSVP